MGYKVVVTADAEEDLNKYFMMYRIVEDIVYVDNIFMNCRIMKVGCANSNNFANGASELLLNNL